ncbi:MAG: alanine/glycine:cation symporter family protein [Rubritalea sp.]|uniref:alanine/glycine:cation symporter family protein n=1 Tax=Rubritalea sp. TaxID=2109375 RepID=UPI003242EBE2
MRFSTNTTSQILSILALSFFFLQDSASAADEAEGADALMGPVADWALNIVFFEIPWTGIPFVLFLLVVSALFLTLYFGFINIRGLKRSIRTVKGRYSKESDPGEITHFQALSSALSATVGLGNIAGVAIAITAGGPGAVFWMILCGVLGMTTKFCECTLGTRYREIDENGKVHGGAMFYLQHGFAELGWAKVGKILAVIFAGACVMASLGAGNMFQGNQAFEQVLAVTGGSDSFFYGKGWLFGLIMAVFVAGVILGGIQSIGRVTAKLVPIMCLTYLAAAAYVLFVHSDQIGSAFGLIFSEAFSFKAGIGGMIGVMIQGLKRAAFSNEAGFGSAPIAHSAVKTTKPASEGYVALLEPFVDTVIVCTMTALVIIITGAQTEGGDWAKAITVTSNAFGSVISWFPYVLFAAVLLFAFSTMISWCYYGEQAWGYLFGKTRRNAFIYKVLFSAVVVLGCSIKLGNVLDFSDAMLFLMCFPNFIGIYVLLPKIKDELKIFNAHADEIDAKLK